MTSEDGLRRGFYLHPVGSLGFEMFQVLTHDGAKVRVHQPSAWASVQPSSRISGVSRGVEAFGSQVSVRRSGSSLGGMRWAVSRTWRIAFSSSA
jgi:hypothetical protein